MSIPPTSSSGGPGLLASCARPLAELFAPAAAERLSAALGPPCLFATDADGTLWRDDLGEAFLQALIRERALASPEAKGVDVWATYEARVAQDKARGYAWAVQIMSGMAEREIELRARAFAAQFVPSRLYPEMGALLVEAVARGVSPWIVSASNRWVVEAAAELLGLDRRRVIGMSTAVRGGILTDEIELPIVYGPGKAEALLRRAGAPPGLAAGDTENDQPMLDASALALLVLHPGKTSPALLRHARERGWLVEAFASSPAP
jgi:HAD superfamily phosphoserine phosphatase-like hydrolase